MSLGSFLIFLLVGAIAGWLAGLIVRGRGFGLIGDIVVGIVGAVIGGFIFNFFLISARGFIGSVITALVGAVILLFIIKLIKRV